MENNRQDTGARERQGKSSNGVLRRSQDLVEHWDGGSRKPQGTGSSTHRGTSPSECSGEAATVDRGLCFVGSTQYSRCLLQSVQCRCCLWPRDLRPCPPSSPGVSGGWLSRPDFSAFPTRVSHGCHPLHICSINEKRKFKTE